MNKQQILKKAQRAIEERRFLAEESCERTLAELRKNIDYKTCESSLRRAQLDGDKDKITACKEQLLNILKANNLSEADLKPKRHCLLCNDTGYVNGEICSCLQQEICKLITAESNVTNSAFTFENSREKDKHNIAVYKKAQTICNEGCGNLLLLGNTGSGKTYLISACVNDIIKQGKSALFTTAYNLNAMFLEAHLSDYQTRQAVLDSLTDVDVLTIDDLGTEINYKNVTAEYLFAIVNERIAGHKQTFITTNLTLADLRDRYDERLFSRLVDTNITTVAQLQGADKRIKK